MQKKYPIGNNDTILQKTTVTFDVSVWEIFWWALVGARVCMLLPGGEKNPAQIVDTIERRKISIIHFVPSMLNTFLDYVKFTGKIAAISSLRQVIASGEPLLPSQVQRFKEVIYNPNLTGLANLYGPTEATIDVTYFDCFTGDNPERVPIGRPIDNTRLYIVNENHSLQPIGIVGELCIAGVGLAGGYINNEELNIEKFVDDPFAPGERMYKTGDLARWLNDGNIEFIGRIDAQVKVRGFRIELAEIESKLLEHDRVKEAVILVKSKGRDDGDKDLFAYIVSDATLSKAELREYLAGKLPYYMIPSHFARIDRIPLTPNGKIDRRALEEKGENMALNSELVKPRNNIEKLVSEAWQEVLHADKLSVNDNFFDLGGASIDMINLSWRLREILKIDNILMEMFKYPTIRLFAGYVARRQGMPGQKDKDMAQMMISLDDIKTGREKQRSKRRLSIQ
jgi:acyl-coenzyme A synthetase/AMP-(fatty) acid ligase/aryl carrier-like protein